MFPVIGHLGPLTIYTYGLLLGISCAVGAHLAVYLAARANVPERRAWWFALAAVVTGIVGGRVHDVAVNAQSLSQFFDQLLVLEHAGRTAYGAFVSATIGALVVGRLLKVSVWRFGDAVAPATMFGLGLTRIGCFAFGCDYGCRTDAWGVCFPKESPAWWDQVKAGQLSETARESLPVLPIQLVESLAGFVIGAILLRAWFVRPRRVGTNFLLFFVLYGLVRALLEQWRADSGRGELLGLSTSTVIGLVTAGGGLALMFVPPLANLRPLEGPVLPPPEVQAAEAAKAAGGKDPPPSAARPTN